MTVPAPCCSPTVPAGDALPELAVDVTPTTVVLGALASRDWRPMHHDYKFATERNGVADIFLNTPNQAAWFERYVTDWTGPRGRLGRMTFRMRTSVFPGRPHGPRRPRSPARGPTPVGSGWVDASRSPSPPTLDRRRTPSRPVATTCTVTRGRAHRRRPTTRGPAAATSGCPDWHRSRPKRDRETRC